MANHFLGRTVDAVVFDAVGTLIHPQPSVAEAYWNVGQRHGSRHDVVEIGRRFRLAFHSEEVRDCAAGYRVDEAGELERWRRIVADVLNDVDDLGTCFAELYAHFARSDAWRCESETGRILRQLIAGGSRVGMASNFDGRLRSVIAGMADWPPLACLVVSSEVGWRKPAPGFFGAIADNLGLPHKRILYVGDDPVNDYGGARAAGLQAVLFDPESKRSRPDIVRRLAELTDYLFGERGA